MSKNIVKIILIIILIFVLREILIFLPFFIEPSIQKISPQTLISSPSTKPETAIIKPLKIPQVPDSWKSLTVNCEDNSFIPSYLKNKSYFCQNIYQLNVNELLSKFQNSNKDRLILYGKNAYFDCPVNLGKTQNLMIKCFNAALFVDSWEIPEMQKITGVATLPNRVFIHYAQSKEDIVAICHLSTASACFDYEDSVLNLYPPKSENDFFSNNPFKASFYEGFDKEIAYSFMMINPQNCYATDVHELIHFFSYQSYGNNVSQWFEEGLAHFLTSKIFKEICPPGPTFINVVRSEAGQNKNVENFDLADLDLEEPLSAALEGYAYKNKCRIAIFKELARLYKEQKLSFIPAFYNQIKTMKRYEAIDYARALYFSEGAPEWLKNYFRQNGCIDGNS